MRFSTSTCYTCKVRRIKCDGTKPTCHRCSKSRRLCLDASAATQADFHIHLENRYANWKTKRPRGPRSRMIVWQPQIDLHTRAVTYYLQYHMPDGADCLAACVQTWKVSGSYCPMVDLAVSCLALAVYSRIIHPSAAKEASTQYSRLLRITQARIAQLGSSKADAREVEACLLGSFLMGRYECAIYSPGLSNGKNTLTTYQNWLHHDGAMGFLKVWHDNLRHESPPTPVIQQARRGAIRSCLLRSRPLPKWMMDGSHFGEHGTSLDYDRILSHTVNLHYETTSLKPGDEVSIAEARRQNIEAHGLDQALQEWTAQLPYTTSYQEHVLSETDDWQRRHFYSNIVYTYPEVRYAAIWSYSFSTRMLVNGIRLRILDLLIHSCHSSVDSFNYEQQREECISTLNAMANNIASTVPFCLQRFKTTSSTLDSPKMDQPSILINTSGETQPSLSALVVWALTIASVVRGVNAKQQLWFRSELANLGRIVGDGVLEGAETNEWGML